MMQKRGLVDFHQQALVPFFFPEIAPMKFTNI